MAKTETPEIESCGFYCLNIGAEEVGQDPRGLYLIALSAYCTNNFCPNRNHSRVISVPRVDADAKDRAIGDFVYDIVSNCPRTFV